MPKISKADFIAIAGLILSVVGVLPFFEINVKTISDLLGSMSGKTVFLTISLLIFAIGLFLKWRERKVTPGNVERKIDQWLQNFRILHAPFDYEPWHFTLSVTFLNQRLFIGRPKSFGGRYIELQLRTVGVNPDHRKAFDAMSKDEKGRFYGQLSLEISRARMLFEGNADLSDITIRKQLPITNDLGEYDVIDGLYQIHQSARVVWTTTALRLADSPVLKQPEETKPSTPPLPKSDTGAPEQSQA
jgi:hypothetical protein